MNEQGQTCGYPPTDHVADTSEILANVLDSLADRLSNREPLPKMMTEKFSGDLLQYPYSNQSFEMVVEHHTNVVSQRMFFLGKCTVGEAHTAIQGYLALNTEEAYHKARAILRRRYGDKYTLAKECKRNIRDWPFVKHGDGKGLRESSDILLHCKTAMQSTNHLCSLDSEEEITRMLEKLPKNINDRWSRIEDKCLNKEDDETQCYPPFEPFCDLLEQEARIACSTLNFKQISTDLKEEKRVVKGFRQKMTARLFSTDAREEENLSGCNEVTVLATPHAPVQSDDRSCVLCER